MNQIISKKEKGLVRVLEMLPGILAWGIIFMPAVGGIFFPEFVAYFILIFVAYWFFKSFKSALFSILGFFLVKDWQTIDWRVRWENDKTKDKLEFDEIKHVVIVPNYNESVKVLSRSLNGFSSQKQINLKNMYIFLAMEERAPQAHERAERLIQKYKKNFGDLCATYHPAGLPGEIVGKASNEAWAAKKAKDYLTKKKINIEKTTITSCDSDAQFHPHYFAALTYSFATSQNRYERFWQSPIFWYNNLHLVPFPIKMLGVIGHAIHLADLQEPSRLIFNYSCYSLSFKLIDYVGYWDTDIIPEDWHLFLQAFFATSGKVEVESLYLPTSIDAPQAQTWFGSLKNRYDQCKRHAWGATDIPYAIIQSLKHPEISLIKKASRVYKMLETHIIWSTNWFILTVGATLPVIINPAFSRTSLGYNLPKIAEAILTICLAALAIMIIVDILLRPDKAKPKTIFAAIKEVVQWATLPLITLPMSVLPGLHAQTMLLFGKRLEYKTTEKV